MAKYFLVSQVRAPLTTGAYKPPWPKWVAGGREAKWFLLPSTKAFGPGGFREAKLRIHCCHTQAKPNQIPKSQNPNPNPGLGGFIITLNRYRHRYHRYHRRHVLFEFSDFHYSYPNQIWNLSFWRQSRHLTSTSPPPLPPPPRPIWIFRLPVFQS